MAGAVSTFAAATAVERLADGRYGAAVQDGWDIGGNANGGYVLAIAGRAMADAAGRRPLTVTAHYLAPVPSGQGEVLVQTIRTGRRFTTCTAALVQNDRHVLSVLGTFGVPAPAEEVTYLADGPPELPPYDECEPFGAGGDPGIIERPPIASRLAIRVRPGDDGFRQGRPTGRAEIAGWFAFPGEQPIDEIALLLVADAFAPAVFNSGLRTGWVPTVELTVHVRATPAPGPLRCLLRTRYVAGGLLEEDGEMWDATGTLVAQSRQLALTARG